MGAAAQHQGVAQPAPAQPQASSSWYMRADWTDEEQEKVRSARNKVIGGVAKLGAGMSSIVTAVGLGVRADDAEDDATQSEQAQTSGWLLFAGAAVAAGFAVSGIADIYDGIKSWTAQIRAHQARLAAAAPQLAPVLGRLDQTDDANARIAVLHQRLQAEDSHLNGIV